MRLFQCEKDTVYHFMPPNVTVSVIPRGQHKGTSFEHTLSALTTQWAAYENFEINTLVKIIPKNIVYLVCPMTGCFAFSWLYFPIWQLKTRECLTPLLLNLDDFNTTIDINHPQYFRSCAPNDYIK